MVDDAYTRNEDGELAVRTVSTSGDTGTNPNDVFTRDDEGRLAIRTTGGGGDQHNLGYFATQAALEEAHPTAEAGDWAIVGATDTAWLWDSDNSRWVDSDQKGQVTSVNGQTGSVVLTASDVGAQETLVSQTNIKSVNGNSLLGSGNLELSTYLPYPSSWTTNSTTAAFCADIAADTSAVVGKAYLGEVTLSDMPSSIANGEIEVKIMDGTTAANKVIVLTLTSGNVAPYKWQYTSWDNGVSTSGWIKIGQQENADWNAVSGVAQILNKPAIPDFVQYSTMPIASADNLGDIVQFTGTTDANYTNGYFYKCTSAGDPVVYSWTQVDVQPTPVIPDPLPSQTGQSGKFLTTDGTDVSWSDKPLVNNAQNGKSAVAIGKGTQENNSGYYSILIDSVGGSNYSTGTNSIAIKGSCDGRNNIAIGGKVTGSNQGGIAFGHGATVSAVSAIQICSDYNNPATNSVANTFKVANANGNFEIMSADGTVPTARLTKVNTTATLAVADWSSNTQTVSVTGVTADSVVFVSPAPASASDYASAGILCTAQAAGTLTFTCDTVPSNAITVNVVCL